MLRSHYGVMSLEQRRLLTDVAGLYKIINSKIDSPDLLAQVSFNVPQRNFRGRNLYRVFQRGLNRGSFLSFLVFKEKSKIANLFNFSCKIQK